MSLLSFIVNWHGIVVSLLSAASGSPVVLQFSVAYSRSMPAYIVRGILGVESQRTRLPFFIGLLIERREEEKIYYRREKSRFQSDIISTSLRVIVFVYLPHGRSPGVPHRVFRNSFAIGSGH